LIQGQNYWLIGYDTHMEAYRMFNPRIKKVIFNHDVILNKTCIELCIQQGVSSLEQNITIEEINFDVYVLSNITPHQRNLETVDGLMKLECFQMCHQHQQEMNIKDPTFLEHHLTQGISLI
jgi:hypothetical protein